MNPPTAADRTAPARAAAPSVAPAVGRPRWLRRRAVTPGAVLTVVIVVQVALLTVMATRVWFFADDWDFLLTRGTIPGESRGWFAGHNGHWSTAVVAVYRTLFALFGLEHYLPYAAVLIGMNVAVCVLVYRILLAVGTPAWTAVGCTSLVVFGGVGSEAMLWVIALSLVGSLLCGLGAVLVWVKAGGTRWSYPAVWALLVIGLMFSGGGITSVVLLGMFAACRSGMRQALTVLSVPALTYLAWYSVVGHEDAPAGLGSWWQVAAVPRLVWTGLSSFAEQTSGLPTGGAPILLLLIVGAFTLPGPEPLRQLAWAGVTASLFNGALIAFTRLSPGEQSRYRYVVLVLLLPALTLWIMAIAHALSGSRTTGRLVAGVLLSAYLVHALHLQHQQFAIHRKNTATGPALITGIITSQALGERLLTPRTGLWFDQDFRADLIGDTALRNKLPNVGPSAAGRLDAERRFFVKVGDSGQGLAGPSQVTPLVGFPDRRTVPREKCRVHQNTSPRAVLQMPTGTGVQVTVRSRTERVSTRLSRDGRRSDQRVWSVRPGTITIATTAQDAVLEVVLERDGGDGTVVICAR